MNPKQLGEFCDQAGCVRASDVGLRKMLRYRKDHVEYLGGEQLRKNRTEHTKAIITKHGDENIITHIDSEEKVHRFCSEPVSEDGAGKTRAYNN